MNNSQNTKRKIDEQELFEDSILEGLEPNTKRNCMNCKHKRISLFDEPCANCRNGSPNWEEK